MIEKFIRAVEQKEKHILSSRSNPAGDIVDEAKIKDRIESIKAELAKAPLPEKERAFLWGKMERVLEARSQEISAIRDSAETQLRAIAEQTLEELAIFLSLDIFFEKRAQVLRAISGEYHTGDWRKINESLAREGISEDLLLNFQKVFHLQADGKAGPETIATLKKMLSSPPKKKKRAPTPKRPGEKSPEKVTKKNEKMALLLSNFEGIKIVENFSGNGGRPVAVLVPKGTDLSQSCEIIYSFHGLRGHHLDDPKSYGAQNLQQVSTATQELGRHKKNVITVYPLNSGTTYNRHWMDGTPKGGDLALLHEQILGTLKRQTGTDISVSKLTLKGHSAGGRTVLNITKTGFPKGIRDVRIDFLDASYGTWATACYREAIARGRRLTFNLFVIPNSQTDNEDSKSLASAKGVQYVSTRKNHYTMNGAYFTYDMLG